MVSNDPHDRTASPERALSAPGRLTVFGEAPTTADVEVLRRGRRWRALRAARNLGIGLVLAPLVALVPPHAPWAIGALVGSVVMARRAYRERLTLVRLDAECPRCGAAIRVTGPVRLQTPHPVPCDACHHEATLHVELDGADADEA